MFLSAKSHAAQKILHSERRNDGFDLNVNIKAETLVAVH